MELTAGAGFAIIMGIVLLIVIIYTIIKLKQQVKEKKIFKKKPDKNSSGEDLN